MKTYKIIGDDGREYGPVTLGEVAQWITDGRANGESQVQPKGEEDWRPLREVPELENLLGGQAPTPPEEPGLPPALNAPTTAAQVLEELGDGPHTFSVRECLGAGWRTYKANAGLFVLSFAIMVVLIFVAVLVPFGTVLVGGPLMGSLDMIMVKRLRGEPARVGNLFDGFKQFMEMFIAFLVSAVIAVLVAIPCLVILLVGLVIIVAMADDGAEASQLITIAVLLGIGSILMAIPAHLAGTMMNFSLPLVLDKKLPGMEAIKTAWGVTKHCKAKCLGLVVTLGIFKFLPNIPFVLGMLVLAITDSFSGRSLLLVGLGGALFAVLVAILITEPFIVATRAAVYEKLFVARAKDSAEL